MRPCASPADDENGAGRATPTPLPIRVLVEGDSLAYTLAKGLGELGQKYHYQSFNLGSVGCGIAVGGPFRDDRGLNHPPAKCEHWPADRKADVHTYDPDVVILLTGCWEVLDRVHNGQWMHIGEPAYDNYLSQQMDLAIKTLSSGGAKVLLLTTPCFAPQEEPDGSTWPFDDPARVAGYNQLLREAAARHRGVAGVADLDAAFCPTGSYSATANGVVVRTADGIHISEAGGLLAANLFASQILALGSPHRAAEALSTPANQSEPPAS